MDSNCVHCDDVRKTRWKLLFPYCELKVRIIHSINALKCAAWVAVAKSNWARLLEPPLQMGIYNVKLNESIEYKLETQEIVTNECKKRSLCMLSRLRAFRILRFQSYALCVLIECSRLNSSACSRIEYSLKLPRTQIFEALSRFSWYY